MKLKNDIETFKNDLEFHNGRPIILVEVFGNVCEGDETVDIFGDEYPLERSYVDLMESIDYTSIIKSIKSLSNDFISDNRDSDFNIRVLLAYKGEKKLCSDGFIETSRLKEIEKYGVDLVESMCVTILNEFINVMVMKYLEK